MRPKQRIILLVLLLASAVTAAEPSVTNLAAQPALVTTVRAKPDALEAALLPAYLSLVATTQNENLEVTGPPFARYVSRGTTKDPRYVVEAGLPIRRKPIGKPSKKVRAITLPGGPAVIVEHKGNRSGLPAAHAKLDAWLTKSGKTARGPRWEVYTTTPLTTPDPDAQVTQLVIPVQP